MFKAFLFFLFLFSFPSFALAVTAGPNSPGTVVDDPGIGTEAWISANNAKDFNPTVENSTSVSSGFLQIKTSHYLKATDFGFNIPHGAVIDGILVTYYRNTGDGSGVLDSEVKIVKGGLIKNTNKASSYWVYQGPPPFPSAEFGGGC